MNKKRLPLLLLPLILIGVLAYVFLFRLGENGRELFLSGHIEATDVDLSFRLSGHLGRVLVQEGQAVKVGDLLAELRQDVYRARLDQARAKVQEVTANQASLELAIKIREQAARGGVEQARAGVSAAGARYQSLKTGSRVEEIRAAEAGFEKARAEYEKRKADYERMKQLFSRDIIAASQFEEAKTAFEAARANQESAREQYNLVKAGPRVEMVEEGKAQLSGSEAGLSVAQAALREVEKLKLDLKVVEAQLGQARAVLAQAEDDFAQTSLTAPFAGVVTVKDVEAGEFVQAGTPVVTLVELDQVWVKAFVPETRLGRVRFGQEAAVTTDSFPGKTYVGRISFISPEAEFTPKNIQTREERVKLVYRIKVTLQNPNQELKPGMPADVLLR
jgi:HlyD family secretion protein